MRNAKKELIEEIGDKKVEFVSIVYGRCYSDHPQIIKGTLEEILPFLDFTYDAGYGSQELRGCIWYEDGTWSDRGEYDGSEWWQHQVRPEKTQDFS